MKVVCVWGALNIQSDKSEFRQREMLREVRKTWVLNKID